MAPYLSLLPVRKNKPPPSALPRPSSTHSTNNLQSLPPLQPLHPTQSTADQDQSLLDFGSLLEGGEEEQSFDLLNDQEAPPDFLADESMWTVGGRTPAKKGMKILEELDEEEEEEQSEKGILRYDDSEDDDQPSPPPIDAANKTLSPNSTSSFPLRPASTPSFRQSPAHQGQALFDESMAMGNYSSNSNQSRSFANNQEEQDSTFTLDNERRVPVEEAVEPHDVADTSPEPEEESESEVEKEEIPEIEAFEREVNESVENGDSVMFGSPRVEEEHPNQAVADQGVDGVGSGEGLQEEEDFQLSQKSCDGGGSGSARQESEYSDPPEETLEDVIEEAGLDMGMLEKDRQVSEDQEAEKEENAIQGHMDEVVPVNFSADADSVASQEDELEEDLVESIVEIARPVQPLPAPLPSSPPALTRKRSSLAPLPQTEIPVSFESHPIPSRVRPRPSFSSAPLPSKRARHSIAASRPAHILPPDHPAHRRRQSVAIIKSSEHEGKDKEKQKAKETASNVGYNEEQVIPAKSAESSDLNERTASIEPPRTSTSAQSTSPRLATPPSDRDLPSPVSNTRLVINPDEAESTTTTIQQPALNSLPILSSTATTPPPQTDTSLPLSPESLEPTSFEGDLTLPMMGAPLSFNPSSLEIGHSTPAKTRPQSRLHSEEEEGLGRRNGMNLGGMAIETIQEVTEEETSFEIVTDRSAEGEVERQIKEEDLGDGAVGMEEEAVEQAEQEERPTTQLEEQSALLPLTRPTEEPLPLPDSVASISGAAAVVCAAVSISPERQPRRAARISLAPPHPVEPIIETATTQPSASSMTSAPISNPAQIRPVPKKRSIRVSLAAPPSQPLRTKTSRRASTCAITSTSALNASLSRREREGRPIRVSLAAPHQSTSLSERRSSAHVDPVHSAIDTPATPQDVPTNAQSEEEESLSAPVASTSQVPLPSTSPQAIQAPLPASATSSKHATLTLPTTFSFASTSNSLTREQERQRRKEERERREKRVEEALKLKKRGMQRGAGWKKSETKSAKDVKGKGKGKEVERENKRPRLATSSNGSTRARPPALETSKPSSVSQNPPRSSEAHPPLLPPVPSITSSVAHAIEVPTQSMSSPILKLTKATLEANRVAAGPRIDLKRRVSTFLEGIEEESRASTSMSREERNEECSEGEPELEQGVQEEEQLELQPLHDLQAVVDAPSTIQAPSAPPAPPAPPPPIAPRPISRNTTRPVTLKASSSRPIAAAPKRKAPPVKTTAAKPFTFAAPRPRPAPSAPSSNAGTASPMFVERLSAWKAREQESIGKGKRKAPPPMPFKTKEVQSTRSAAAAAVSVPPPGAKRPRVAPPVAEQGRKGKENAPARRPVVAEKQKPVGKPVMISGGVAEEMEKRLKEKLEWSERQKQREEEVKRRREEAQMSEADRERQKLQALRSSLSTDRRSTAATQAVVPPRGRANPVGRV